MRPVSRIVVQILPRYHGRGAIVDAEPNASEDAISLNVSYVELGNTA